MSSALHWLAGLWEGEGCFGFKKSGARYAFASLAMTDKDVVERVAKMLGAKVYLRPARWKMTKPQYCVVLAARRAIGLMMTLYGLMGERRKAQIREALKLWRERPGTGSAERAKTACPRGHAYTVYNDKGWRHCLTCRNERSNARYHAKRKRAA